MSNTKVEIFHGLILLFQRRMRTLRHRIPAPLDPVQAITLSWLAHDPNLSPSGIGKKLKLSKSRVSRLISALRELGCIQTRSAAHDKRAIEMEFTEKGTLLLDEIILINSQIAETGMRRLAPKERMRFIHFLDLLNTGLGIEAMPTKPGENPLVPQQMRIVQGTNMLGRSYMDTGLELGAYHIIFELARTEEKLGFSDLLSRFPIHPSKLSRILASLIQRKYIEKQQSADDKRTVCLNLSEQGRIAYNKYETEIAKLYRKALSNLSKAELGEFAGLLRTVIETPLPTLESEDLTAAICKSSFERKRARAFLVEQLVQEDLHHDLGSELLPETSICAVLYRESEVVGLIETLSQKGSGKVVYFFLTTTQSPDLRKHAQKLLRILFEHGELKSLELPLGIVPTNIRTVLWPKAAEGERICIAASDLSSI